MRAPGFASRVRETKEASMTLAIGGRRSGMFSRFAAWWRNMRAERTSLGELENCGDEVGHIARDVGLTRHDLYTIAAKRPDAADQLKQRLEALHMDRAALLDADSM